MARYIHDSIIEGTRYGSTESITRLRAAYKSGQIQTFTTVMKEGQRLDTLAGMFLGDASLWWIIAVLSGIGWGLQVPPGTKLLIPTKISSLEGFL
jgi:hypothetical protein